MFLPLLSLHKQSVIEYEKLIKSFFRSFPENGAKKPVKDRPNKVSISNTASPCQWLSAGKSAIGWFCMIESSIFYTNFHVANAEMLCYITVRKGDTNVQVKSQGFKWTGTSKTWPPSQREIFRHKRASRLEIDMTLWCIRDGSQQKRRQGQIRRKRG